MVSRPDGTWSCLASMAACLAFSASLSLGLKQSPISRSSTCMPSHTGMPL